MSPWREVSPDPCWSEGPWREVSPEERCPPWSEGPLKRGVSWSEGPWREVSPDQRVPRREVSPDQRVPWREVSPDERVPWREVSPDQRVLWKEASPDQRVPWREVSPDQRFPEERCPLIRGSLKRGITVLLYQGTTKFIITLEICCRQSWNVSRVSTQCKASSVSLREWHDRVVRPPLELPSSSPHCSELPTLILQIFIYFYLSISYPPKGEVQHDKIYNITW